MSNFEETGPLRAPVQPEPEPDGSTRGWLLWVLAIVLFAIFVLGVGVISGYASGLTQRNSRSDDENTLIVQEQFDLGVQDLLDGRYELARQRFAYILEI